tara:strand:+ start:42 stop:230 length:189 start_codon:yes stop_codon:yes gene_type:complete
MACNTNACKKSELVSAINSFASARASGDANLVQFAGQLVGKYIETLEFAPEAEEGADDNQSE